ncbi:hypothetical protein DFH94DRAFT_637732 [Russula ochroleuca]|jgi:hypothetical protein|uniref:SWIM-type domain-containing protein n=1 Tax=Russula ochroleuca TaxID=152965 RepID=A0A9P5JY75_9AGAM|nr:hypothetical protein DFH94DRAFT_637732 [Russula ochroleuca]
MVHDTCWHKQFKHEWKKLAATPITMPLNNKYRPDAHKWVCTCPSFVRSRFLICKHLIQAVQPVLPIFFLQVKQNQTLPFWQHSMLVPLKGKPTAPKPYPSIGNENCDDLSRDSTSDNEDNVDDIVNTEATIWAGEGDTYHEQMVKTIKTIRNFCDGLEYQLQFDDKRMLEMLEHDSAAFLQLAKAGLGQERRMNTTRGSSPTTWEQGATGTMWY